VARVCALAVLVVLGLVGYRARPASAQLNCDVGVDFYPDPPRTPIAMTSTMVRRS
jgi:hypothetical protein